MLVKGRDGGVKAWSETKTDFVIQKEDFLYV